MTAEIYEFPGVAAEKIECGTHEPPSVVVLTKREEIARLRAIMKDRHLDMMHNGGDSPLCALVWHQVDAAMKSDDLVIVNTAASALEEFLNLTDAGIPF